VQHHSSQLSLYEDIPEVAAIVKQSASLAAEQKAAKLTTQVPAKMGSTRTQTRGNACCRQHACCHAQDVGHVVLTFVVPACCAMHVMPV
jgi:hypothetical protein